MRITLLYCAAADFADSYGPVLLAQSVEHLLKSEGHQVEVFYARSVPREILHGTPDRFLILGNPFSDPLSPLSEWLVSLRPEVRKLTHIVGLHGLSAGTLLEGHREILKEIAAHAPIGVSDSLTMEALGKTFTSKMTSLIGCPGYWLESGAFRLRKPTRLFSPGARDEVFGNKRGAYQKLVRRYYWFGNTRQATLFAPPDKSVLDYVPPLATRCFYQPETPSLYARALVSASGVVASHASSLLVAVQHGVPAILFGNDRHERSLAEAYGIPFLELHENSQAEELVQRTEEVFNRYPWETVKQRTGKFQNEARTLFQDLGLVSKTAPKKKAAPTMDTHWATCATESSVSSVLGWVENIHSLHEGRQHFHILCSSRRVRASLDSSLKSGTWTSYSFSDLWSLEQWTSVGRYPVESALRASIPRLLLAALKEAKTGVVYSDPDTLFWHSVHATLLPAGVRATLVPRHLESPAETATVGLYSTSLMGVQPDAGPFLEWWAGLCVAPASMGQTYDDFHEGKVLDSAPLLMDRVLPLSQPILLGEPGNSRSLGLERPSWPGEMVRIDPSTALASFLARGTDRMRVCDVKTGWDQLSSAFCQNGLACQGATLKRAVRHQQRFQWRRLDTFLCVQEWMENHIPLTRHEPSDREVATFVRGWGHWLVAALERLGMTAPPFGNARRTASGSQFPLWVRWQRTLLRGLGLHQERRSSSHPIPEIQASHGAVA